MRRRDVAGEAATGEAREGDKAARIFEAADRLFGERGFDGVSVGDVALAAGVNKALIFYYFRSKEALYGQVLGRYYAAHQAALEAAFQPTLAPRARIHALIDGYVDFVEQHQRHPRMVQHQVTAGIELAGVQAGVAALHRSVAAALADLVPAEGPLAARHFFVTFSAVVVNYFTYAPALGDVWVGDPLGVAALAERRAHLHWLVEAVLDRLAEPAATAR